MPEAGAWEAVDAAVAGQAGEWDLAGQIPVDRLRGLGKRGVLCPEVPTRFGGLELSSMDSGELAAYTGGLCGSVRSIMTSQSMAARAVQRLAGTRQQQEWLPRLTGGALAAVAFSEPGAGSDLSGMTTTVREDGDSVVVDGHKVWVTGASYADLLVVFGTYEGGGAAVVVPADTPGVTVTRVANPLGCRAAGHADVTLASVRLPATHVLGGGEQPLSMLVTATLAAGRMSVAWGCVGILRVCLRAATRHARSRVQFGVPIAQHQLVSRHLAELLVAEQNATRACEHASRCWDSGSAEAVMATVLAKHVSAGCAAQGASAAVQVLASAGARDGEIVARAYRDAKLMEIIEGSNEICQLILAQHALEAWA